jgi:hypothetical protein
MSDGGFMVYAPPSVSEATKLKVQEQRRFRKKNTEIENFLFFHDKDRRLTMATHNSEGVYDRFSLVTDFDLMEMCVYMTSLEIFITDVITLSHPHEPDKYHIIYDGKIICSTPIHILIKKLSFERALTQAAKVYLSEKD